MTLSTRRNDIDWLRVFATYLLFVFHGAMIFSPAPFFHVRNGDVSMVMMVLAGFISLWHMPLFFLLAGWSAHASLAARGSSGFVRERIVKLFVPLAAGCIVIGPLLKYIELRGGLDLSFSGLRVAEPLQESFRSVIPGGLPVAPPFQESFFEFLPTFYTQLDRFTWSHLWFIAYLFTFSLLYVPLFRWLLRLPDRKRTPHAAWVYVPVAPLAAIQVFLRPHWPGVQNLIDDWANFAFYSTFLILGFLMARHPSFEAAVHRERKRALAVSLVTMLVLLLALLGVVRSEPLLLTGSAVAGWCSVVAILGFARERLATHERGLGYLRESAFPVYILHQPALVVFGYWLVGTSFGIPAKFLLILLLSVAATLAYYHFVVRRVGLLRLIYGMKPHRTSATRGHTPSWAATAVLAAFVAAPAPIADAFANSPVGLWWAEGGAAKVEIAQCEDALCGRVVWLRSPFDESGCQLTDAHNPDPRLQVRPVLGLEILRGLAPASDQPSQWTGGTIYDPGSGRTYRCALALEDENGLAIRGYLGVPLLGRTTRWTRVGSEATRCSDWRAGK
jgi:uncharacterized protein (DUF2147 family)